MSSSFRSYVTSSVGTANTTVFSSTTSTTVIGFSIANTSNSAITASAILNKNGSSSVYIVKNAPIPYGGSLVIVGGDQKIVMQVSDTLSVNASNTADTIISTLEIS